MRGGKRKGAGRKPKYSSKSVCIKVPIDHKARILEVAKWLNDGGHVEFYLPGNKGLSGRALARRWGCSPSLVSEQRHRSDFLAWSKKKDPEDIAWQYSGGKFYPFQ